MKSWYETAKMPPPLLFDICSFEGIKFLTEAKWEAGDSKVKRDFWDPSRRVRFLWGVRTLCHAESQVKERDKITNNEEK